MEIRDPSGLASRLDELRELKDGWLDGSGRSLNSTDLARFESLFAAQYSSELPRPFVYPTTEGGIQLEWTSGSIEVSIEVELHTGKGQYHHLDLATGAAIDLSIDLHQPSWVKQFSTSMRDATERENISDTST